MFFPKTFDIFVRFIWNIIEVRIPNEPKDVAVVINKQDASDDGVFLSDAKFTIIDTQTNNEYTSYIFSKYFE